METIQTVKRELSETTSQVKAFLIADDRCKNDDTWLLYKIFCLRTGLTEKDFPFKFFSAISCFETVRRVRQKLQEEEPDLFGPTDPAVIAKRNKRAEAFRQIFAKRNVTI